MARIYELASDLNLSSASLIEFLYSKGFEVKSHMASVTEEMLTAVEGRFKMGKEVTARHKRNLGNPPSASETSSNVSSLPEPKVAQQTYKLHIFIDGTWLVKNCSPHKALAFVTSTPESKFIIDWSRFDNMLLKHLAKTGVSASLGDKVLVTSIFEFPKNFEKWPSKFKPRPGMKSVVTRGQVEKAKDTVEIWEKFVNRAFANGYSRKAILRPTIRPDMLQRLTDGKYEEKGVDTLLAGLIVRSAIIRPQDYHCIVSGDLDILSTLRIVCSEYTRNIMLVTLHPGELDPYRRASSSSYLDFEFDVPPLFLQQHTDEFMPDNVYRCGECGKLFSEKEPLDSSKQPRCKLHRT